MHRYGHAALVLLIFLSGCYRFDNPVDPEAANYQDPTQAPPAPASLDAEIPETEGDTRVHLTWEDTSVVEDGFRLDYKIGAGAYFEHPDSPFGPASGIGSTVDEMITGLTGETDYTFRVRAFNAAGDSPFSNEVAVTTGPVAPSGLILTPLAGPEIQLDWTDNSSTEIFFRLYRSINGGSYDFVSFVFANTTTWTDDSGFISGDNLSYRVIAWTFSTDSAAAEAGPVAAP